MMSALEFYNIWIFMASTTTEKIICLCNKNLSNSEWNEVSVFGLNLAAEFRISPWLEKERLLPLVTTTCFWKVNYGTKTEDGCLIPLKLIHLFQAVSVLSSTQARKIYWERGSLLLTMLGRREIVKQAKFGCGVVSSSFSVAVSSIWKAIICPAVFKH